MKVIQRKEFGEEKHLFGIFLETNLLISLIKKKKKHIVYLGEILTSNNQGFRFSSNMTSQPNNSWQQDLK